MYKLPGFQRLRGSRSTIRGRSCIGESCQIEVAQFAGTVGQFVGQAVSMPDTHPTVTLDLWRSDAIVLFDWLKRTDMSALPTEHPAEKQALTDLLSLLETKDVASVTQGEI